MKAITNESCSLKLKNCKTICQKKYLEWLLNPKDCLNL